ncbi:MAG TPA: NAD-dependent malic enzyme [Vicinamibacterales bacterium]|jgi:malate dehydrogenase (oxaloacetate-decarboxylating)(NADP+)|nr:NAD-dependent malic enzyme [Vicinamibacterales bacterium]
MIPHGAALLRDPVLNKGTAFTPAERLALGLRGLLPPHVSTQAEQAQRVVENFRGKSSPLEKYIDLAALHDRNETLFFRVLADHLVEMLPIVYTPTVGLAAQRYAHIFQRPRGVFISAADRGHVAEALANWPERDVKMIVVTDGERILGLGDLGADGMVIPIGKLAIYTAAAGIPPVHCLPVTLDVGTNNEQLLADPLYIGLHQRRLTGAAYDSLVEEFVMAVQQVFPGAIIQFEDFANHNAFRLLERYRTRVCTFNDDIQGTAAVALAGLLSALRLTGGALTGQRLLFLGAGEAAIGIASLTVSALVAAGLPEAEARRRCWMVNSRGLVVRSRTDLADHKWPFAHDHEPLPDLLSSIRAIRPTALIGAAAVAGAFTREVIDEMTRLNARPIIFSLSNPTSKAECTAAQAYECSGGCAVFASGSPFDPVTLGGRTFVPRQGNNCYIFPGVGLAALAVGARHISDEMFLAAAHALAHSVSEEDLDCGAIFPSLTMMRDVSVEVAVAVAEVAYRQGHATVARPTNLRAFVSAAMWDPAYPVYVPDASPHPAGARHSP